MVDASKSVIPFETFASFKKIETGNPIISLTPPFWAAATHAIVIDDTVHYITFEPNPYNPVFTPSDDPDAFDCDGVLTGQIFEVGNTYAMLYAGKKGQEWQTGLCTFLEN